MKKSNYKEIISADVTVMEQTWGLIKGTKDFRDVVINMNSDEAPFLNGFSHGGMLGGAKRIMKECREAIQKAVNDHPDYRLVITGHSLGGGTAILITMDLLNGDHNITNLETKNIKCIAIAPPPVYRSQSHNETDKFKEHIKIIIHENDIVTTLSVATIAKVIAISKALAREKLKYEDYYTILTGSDKYTLQYKSMFFFQNIL